jgi:hypothetical protein
MNLIEELQSDKDARVAKSSNNTSSSSPYSLFSTDDNPKQISSSSNHVFESGNSFSMPLFDWKSILILILLVLVIFSYYGINLLSLLGDALQTWVSKISPIFTSFFDLLGDSTGSAINKTAELTSDAAKVGIDIAEGSIQDIGNLLIGDKSIGKSHSKKQDPEPDASENSIQKSLSSAKTKWCLVGEYQNKRGCIDISESDKCLSGEVFPNEKMCLNPTMTPTQP